MTNPANFPRLHQINPTLDQTADIIDAETVSPDSEAAAIVKRVPDSTAIAQSFLVHYESFVGSPIDHALVWRTETFGSQEDASPWSPSWRKVGVVGIGGLATVAAASALLPKDTLQGVAQAAQKLVSNSSPESRSARSAAANQAQSSGVTAANSIAFGTTLPEFSSSSATPKPSMPKIKVPAVISPAIRAPLPGQVIGQQPVAAAPARQLPLRGTAKPSKPSPSTKPRAIDQPASASKQRTLRNLTAENTASRAAALPLLAPSTAPLPVQPNAAASQTNAIQGQSSSTPMPPSQMPQATPPSTPIARAKAVQPIAPISATPEYSQPSPEPKRQNAILGNLPQPLTQAIEKAQTIQDFLALSPQLSKNTLAVLSMTSQAAIAVPNAGELEQFQIFRFPVSTYQKAWSASTQAAGQPLSAPAHGFIDYQQKAIVLPLSNENKSAK